MRFRGRGPGHLGEGPRAFGVEKIGIFESSNSEFLGFWKKVAQLAGSRKSAFQKKMDLKKTTQLAGRLSRRISNFHFSHISPLTPDQPPLRAAECYFPGLLSTSQLATRSSEQLLKSNFWKAKILSWKKRIVFFWKIFRTRNRIFFYIRRFSSPGEEDFSFWKKRIFCFWKLNIFVWKRNVFFWMKKIFFFFLRKERISSWK